MKIDISAITVFLWFNIILCISSHLQRMYLVMELCDAGGIQKLLERKTRFSEKVCIVCVSLTIYGVLSDGALIMLHVFLFYLLGIPV